MNSISKVGTRSQIFARCIVDLAFSEYGLSALEITPNMFSSLSDMALLRYPDACDVHFREMAVGRILCYQRYCRRQEVARRLVADRLL